MSLKKMGLLLALGFCAEASAFTCYFTVAKDSCWTDYDVRVTAVDVTSGKELVAVQVPAKKSWARSRFVCSPGQNLKYLASYSPEFWDSEKGKKYQSKNYRLLNAQIEPGHTAWDIQVCFSEAFAEVPFPPKGHKDCKCDFSQIPSPQ